MELTTEEAVVEEVKNGFAYLTADNTSCESCSSQAGCGSFTFFSKSPKRAFKVTNSLDLVKGDRVMVELKSEKLMLGTFVIYILPLLSLLFFSVLGKTFGEGFSIIFGISGFVLSLLLTKYFMSQKDISDQFEPTILKKIITINPST